MKHRRAHHAVLGVLGIALLLSFGPGKTTPDVAQWAWWAPKVQRLPERSAKQVAAMTQPDDMVLATPEVAWHLAMMPRRPKLVGVWNRYIDNLARHWGPDHARQRKKLMGFVRNRTFTPPAEPLNALCVSVVVVNPQHRTHTQSAGGLEALGFSRVAGGPNDVWRRPAAAMPDTCVHPTPP